MVKAIIFDCDGPVIKRDMYFSQRLAKEGRALNTEKITSFFKVILFCAKSERRI